MAGFDITSNMLENTSKMKVLRAVTVFGVLAAVCYGYLSVFEMGMTIYHVLVPLGIVVLISSALLWEKENRKKKMRVTFVSLGILTVLLGYSVYTGIMAHVNSYTKLLQLYYEYEVPISNPDVDGAFLVLLILTFLLSLLLSLILEKKKGIFIVILLLLFPILLASTVGELPGTWSFFFLLTAGCVYLIVYHQNEERFSMREVVVTVGVLAGFWACSFVVQPFISEYKETHTEEYRNIKDTLLAYQEKILECFPNFMEFGSKSVGGMAQGSLKHLDSVELTGDHQMTIVVTEQPTQGIYLKAFAGTTYMGTEWKKIGMFEFSEIASAVGGNDKKLALMEEPFRRIAIGPNRLRQVRMNIELIEASSEYAYVPYYADIPSGYKVYVDAYVEGDGKKNQTYMYYPQEYVKTTGSWKTDLAEESDLWKQYSEFVQKTYIKDYPELEQLKKLCEGGSVQTVSDRIEKLFTGFRYSRTPGETPEGYDLVEGFVFETKRGFCVHFATAATVIYQMSGVPARYVEGYYVSPNLFVEQEDGTYKATITDSEAHAWCETFDEEYGWQVQEHTVGYGRTGSTGSNIVVPPVTTTPSTPQQEKPKEDISGGTTTEGNKQEDVKNEETKKENTENETEEQIGNGNVQEGELEGTITKEILICVIGMGSVLALVFIIVLQRNMRWVKRIKNFRKKKDNQGITNIYNAIYEMCVFAGLKKVQETERERLARMMETFSQLSEEEWNWLYLQAEQAAFSGKAFTKTEWREMHHLYGKLRKELLKTFNWPKRIWFLYGRAM